MKKSLSSGAVAVEKAPNKFLEMLKKHKFLVILVVLLVAAIIAGSVYLGIITNKFRGDKLNKIELGANETSVEKVLGKADSISTEDNAWYYYKGKAKGLLEDIKADSTNQKAIDKLAKLKYNFIKVSFAMDKDKEENVVTSLVLDTKHKYVVGENGIDDTATTKKKGKKINLSNSNLEQNGDVKDRDIVYSLNYSDGSFIKAQLTEVECDTSTLTDYFSDNSDDKDDTRDAKFTDMNGWDSFTVPVKVKPKDLIFFESIKRTDANGKAITRYEIPVGMTQISRNAFKDWVGLKEIIIPNTVTLIDTQAFNGCTGLTNVVLPDSIVTIGEFAFDKCTRLENINIPTSVKEIKKFAFDQCKKLSSIFLPSTIEIVGRGAFYDCRKLTINYEGATIPSTWDATWNESNRDVNFNVARG